MDWKAKHNERENALLRTFFMLVFVFLLVVRIHLDRKAAACVHPYGPPLMPSGHTGFAGEDQPPASLPGLTVRPEEAIIMLLAAIRLMADALFDAIRDDCELMNEAHVQAKSLRLVAARPTRQCDQAISYFDTS